MKKHLITWLYAAALSASFCSITYAAETAPAPKANIPVEVEDGLPTSVNGQVTDS